MKNVCHSKDSLGIFFLLSLSYWLCLQLLHNWHEVWLLETTAIFETHTHCLLRSLSARPRTRLCLVERGRTRDKLRQKKKKLLRAEIRHFPEEGNSGRNHTTNIFKTHATAGSSAEKKASNMESWSGSAGTDPSAWRSWTTANEQRIVGADF